MKVIKTECYKTTDNSLFISAVEANKHQAWLDFADWYATDVTLSDYAVNVADMAMWLEANRERILRYLNP